MVRPASSKPWLCMLEPCSSFIVASLLHQIEFIIALNCTRTCAGDTGMSITRVFRELTGFAVHVNHILRIKCSYSVLS